MSLKQEAQELQGYLTALRREFHRHPEVSRKELWTAERIEKELDSIGITEHRRVDGSGVYAVLRGELGGERVMALRADIDALPIEERHPDLEYCSREAGVMHACGHDGHITCLLGAAKLLYAHKGEFGGEVRFFFQHAEEVGYGADRFMETDLWHGAGRVFGLHVAPDLPTGQVGIKAGANNASVDHFTITIKGTAAHVSLPHKGADAVYMASQIVVALQSLVTRLTSPVEPLLIGVGKITAGDAYNIVADHAVLEGTVRAVSVETRQATQERMDTLCRQTAALYGGSATVEWEDFTCPLVNPADICREAGALVTEVFGGEALVTDRPLSLGGDDFARFQKKIPGVYAYLGCGNPDKPDSLRPLHNEKFDLDEAALPIGATLHAEYAMRYLSGALG